MNDSASGGPGLHAERGVGPDPDPGGLAEGVSSSLSELERKLRLLESELSAVTDRDAPGRSSEDPAVTWAPAPPAPAREAAPGAGVARGGDAPSVPSTDLELLLRFRDQLERYSRALVTDYGRLLAHLGIDVPPATPWAASAGAPGVEAAARAGAASPADAGQSGAEGVEWASEVERPTEYSGRGLVYEDILLEGSVVLEVGPLSGLNGLRELEQQLAALSGVEVGVRAFESGRAALDLRLEGSRRLVGELRGVLSRQFSILDAAPGRLSIVLTTAGHGA